MLSQGVPMLLHGDELGRTQGGNNNGYAQDNEITWVDWEAADLPLLEFTAAMSRLRASHPTFRRSRFFNGRPVPTDEGAPVPDIVWLRPDGSVMRPEDWDNGFGLSVGMFLNGRGIREKDRRGQPVSDLNFIVFFNSGDDGLELRLPPERYGAQWQIMVDTAGENIDGEPVAAGAAVAIEGRTLMVLREVDDEEAPRDDSVEASLRAQVDRAGEHPAPAPKAEA
jgi:isoamylase